MVPEETRATIYNIYRVPLNAIVLGVLLNHISTTTALTCCAGMLFVAFVCQRALSERIAVLHSSPEYAATKLSDDEKATLSP